MVNKYRLTLFKCVIHIEQCKMVSVDVREPHLGLVRLFFHLVRSHEALWY